MPRRYWLSVIAAIGFLAGSEQGHSQGAPGSRSDRPQHSQQEPSSLPPSVQFDIHRIARALDSDKSPEPSENEKRNTKAQEDVAWWAPSLFWLGLFELLITSYGVLLVRKTLKEARATTEAARDSVDEARAATELTRQIGHAETRAWIKPEVRIGAITIFDAASSVGLNTGISFVLRNVGNAPAISITTHAWPYINDGAVPLWEEAARLCESVRSHNAKRIDGTMLFPGETFPASISLSGYTETISMPQMALAKIRSSGTNIIPLYIIGCIEYTFPTDPTGSHQTRFAYTVQRESPALITTDPGMIPETDLFLMDASPLWGRYAD